MSKIADALSYYYRHIHDPEKVKLLQENKLKVAGSVPSVLWELFGAILTGRAGTGVTGADLLGWEVKSAKMGGSYEYQYHLNTGEKKLNDDCKVNHLYCAYSATYEDVVVRVIQGADLASKFFNAWKPEYCENYNASAPASERRQRFRKNIPYRYVEKNGRLVLMIKAGIITSSDESLLEQFNRE